MSSLSDILTAPLLRPQRKVVAPAVSVARFDEQFPTAGADRRGSATPEQAWTAGYEVGLEQGMSCGRAATEADIAAADRRAAIVVDAVHRAADRIIAELRTQFSDASDSVLGTAYDVAFAVIDRDLRSSPRTGEDALRAALALVPAHEPCVARLHPSDVALLNESAHVDLLSTLSAGRAEFSIVSDPTVASGDCVIDMESARVEHRLADALTRVRNAMRADDLTRSMTDPESVR
jgi:flagellar assembly protein FliH